MARAQSFCKQNVMEWSRVSYIYIYIYMYVSMYIYIYIYTKTDCIFENIFRLMSLSIHSLFTIKTATKILSYNQSVIIIVGN